MPSGGGRFGAMSAERENKLYAWAEQQRKMSEGPHAKRRHARKDDHRDAETRRWPAPSWAPRIIGRIESDRWTPCPAEAGRRAAGPGSVNPRGGSTREICGTTLCALRYAPESGSMAALARSAFRAKSGAVACRLIHDVKDRHARPNWLLTGTEGRYRTK
jgi:hypothetical protein